MRSLLFLAKYTQTLVLGVLILLFLGSCNSSGSENSSSGIGDLFSSNLGSDRVKAALDAALSNHPDSSNDVSQQLSKLYEASSNQAIWVKNNRISDKGKAMVESLGKLKADGLDPEKYGYSSLAKSLSEKVDNDDSLAHLEVDISKNATLAAHDLIFGVLNPKTIDKEWHAQNDSTFSVAEAFTKDIEKGKDPLDAFRPQNPRYALMLKDIAKWEALKTDSTYQSLQKNLAQNTSDATVYSLIKKQINSTATDSNLVKAYQYLNNASVNGKVDEDLLTLLKRNPDHYIAQLKLNLERLRWLPNDWKSQYIWVSIPQAEVDYFDGNENKFHERSIVGAKATQTPSLLKPMQNIVVCPPWNLPASIVKKDYNGRIPGKYIVYKGGKRVSNSAVNSSNFRQFQIQQPAGPSAALGYVKFNLPNPWDIYLHDTPNRSLFANKNRYLSHGCVRIRDPRRLASIILEDKGLTVDSISTMIKKNRTTAIKTELIPVYILYMTIGSDSTLSNPIFLNDPYKKDSVLKANLISFK